MKQYSKAINLLKDHPVIKDDTTGFLARVVEGMLKSFQTRFEMEKLDLAKNTIKYSWDIKNIDKSHDIIAFIATIEPKEEELKPEFKLPKFS